MPPSPMSPLPSGRTTSRPFYGLLLTLEEWAERRQRRANAI
jgi:hypothetical protein